MSECSIRILGIGSSHLFAIERGYNLIKSRSRKGSAPDIPIDLSPIQLREERYRPQTHVVNKAVTLNTALGDDIRKMVHDKSPTAILSCIGGAVHMEAGWRKYAQRFDTVLPDRLDLPFEDSAVFVPYSAVRDSLAQRSSGFFSIMNLVRELAPIKFYQFCPPPPIADTDRIKEHVKKWEGQPIEVAKASVRYKLWRCYVDALIQHCREAQIVFVPHPAVTCDLDGFLKDEFASNDAHHANELYGEKALLEFTRILNSDAAAEEHRASL